MCLLLNINSCKKLVSPIASPIIFCKVFNGGFLGFFVDDFDLSKFLVADFNPSSSEFDNSTLHYDIESFYVDTVSSQNKLMKCFIIFLEILVRNPK